MKTSPFGKLNWTLLVVLLISSCKKEDSGFVYSYHIKGVITELVTGNPVQNTRVETFNPFYTDAFGSHPETTYEYGFTDDSGKFDISVQSNGPTGQWLRLVRGCGEEFQMSSPYGYIPDTNIYFIDSLVYIHAHAVSTIEVVLTDTGFVTSIDSILIFKECGLSLLPDPAIIIYDAATGQAIFQDYGGKQSFEVEIYSPTTPLGRFETIDVPDGGVGLLEIKY